MNDIRQRRGEALAKVRIATATREPRLCAILRSVAWHVGDASPHLQELSTGDELYERFFQQMIVRAIQ